jgi:hypothetical protein
VHAGEPVAARLTPAQVGDAERRQIAPGARFEHAHDVQGLELRRGLAIACTARIQPVVSGHVEQILRARAVSRQRERMGH